jgi:CRP-like cAMP-binding protein
VKNRLLNALSPTELDQLRPYLDAVPLKAKRILHHFNTPMDHIWFVESGLVSVTARVSEGMNVEVWLIGCEGMTGIPVLLGADETPPHRRIVQVEGTALRMTSADLRRVIAEVPRVREILLRYAQVVLLQASQVGACNGHHTLQQRLARWLLMAQDRLLTDELALTHELLSRMLGVRRASVTASIATLESIGAIDKGRGFLRVADREKLEGQACDCRRIIKMAYERLLPGNSAQ